MDSPGSPFPTPPSPEEIKAFCMAAIQKDAGTINLLLEKYGAAIINERDDIKAVGLTWAASCNNKEIVELLLEKGAHIEALGTNDRTALGYAALSGSPDLVSFLLKKGAALEARDEQGQTALMQARDSDTATILLETGASPDARDNQGKTALMLAQDSGRTGVAATIEQYLDKQRRLKEQAEAKKARELTEAQLEKLKRNRLPPTQLKKKKHQP